MYFLFKKFDYVENIFSYITLFTDIMQMERNKQKRNTRLCYNIKTSRILNPAAEIRIIYSGPKDLNHHKLPTVR